MTPSRKSIAKSLFHGSRCAMVQNCFKDSKLTKIIINKVGRIIQLEIAKLCSMKVDSILRLPVQSFERFSWSSLFDEFLQYAPVLHSLLMIVTKTKQRCRTKPEIIVGTIISVLCKYRCSSMSLLQKMLSICLYANQLPRR